MNIANQVKALVREREAAGLVQTPMPKDHPTQDPLKLALWLYIRDGHKAGPHQRPLVGASDLEIREHFGSHNNPNTLRLARYGLEKAGYIEQTGMKRNTIVGRKKAHVYRVTDKWDGPEDETPSDVIVLEEGTGYVKT